MAYDSFKVNLASHFSKKMVVLYNSYSQHSYPYWSDPKDIVLLEMDYEEHGKPSYSYGDPLDLMNKIEYTTITNSVLKLLGIQ